VAFTIEEDFQGLDGQLQAALDVIARGHGIVCFDAEVLTVFRRSDLPLTLRRAGDVVHLSLSLVQPS